MNKLVHVSGDIKKQMTGINEVKAYLEGNYGEVDKGELLEIMKKNKINDVPNSTVNQLINKYSAKQYNQPSTQAKKPITQSQMKKVKVNTPVIRSLIKMGENLAESNKLDKEKKAAEEATNFRVQQRTDAYLKDYYELLNQN